MSDIKRLRIIAGPNGSGKTTLYEIISETYNMGVFVNADIIEKELSENKKTNLDSFNLQLNKCLFLDQFKNSSFFIPSNGSFLLSELFFEGNFICLKDISHLNSYFAVFIANYVREELLLLGKKFTIETVLSDKRKLDFMRSAKNMGYRVYLYFITTMDPKINIDRVAARVNLNGHSVPEEKIRSRYAKSLDNLFEAIMICDRAFIFDNSSREPIFIAEKEDNHIKNKQSSPPKWYQEHVLLNLNK